MRPIERIDSTMAEIGEIWKKNCPDWRFGQLIFNYISTVGDPFYLEEDAFIVGLRAYFNNEDPRKAIMDHLEAKFGAGVKNG